MKVLLKKVGCPLEVVETDQRYFGDCVRSFLGEYITVERVYMGESFGGKSQFEFIMGVDEDGLPKQLPLNFLLPFNNPFFPIQKIVGDIVFIRNKPCNPYKSEIWDFEVADITSDDIKKVEDILNPERQKSLAIAFGNKY